MKYTRIETATSHEVLVELMRKRHKRAKEVLYNFPEANLRVSYEFGHNNSWWGVSVFYWESAADIPERLIPESFRGRYHRVDKAFKGHLFKEVLREASEFMHNLRNRIETQRIVFAEPPRNQPPQEPAPPKKRATKRARKAT